VLGRLKRNSAAAPGMTGGKGAASGVRPSHVDELSAAVDQLALGDCRRAGLKPLQQNRLLASASAETASQSLLEARAASCLHDTASALSSAPSSDSDVDEDSSLGGACASNSKHGVDEAAPYADASTSDGHANGSSGSSQSVQGRPEAQAASETEGELVLGDGAFVLPGPVHRTLYPHQVVFSDISFAGWTGADKCVCEICVAMMVGGKGGVWGRYWQ
jgi:hypothetical protein